MAKMTDPIFIAEFDGGHRTCTVVFCSPDTLDLDRAVMLARRACNSKRFKHAVRTQRTIRYQESRLKLAEQKKHDAESDLKKNRAAAEMISDEKLRYKAARDAREAERRKQEAEYTIMKARAAHYEARAKAEEQKGKARATPGEVAQRVGGQLRRGEIGVREVEEATRKIAQPYRRRPLSTLAVAEKEIRRLLREIEKILDPKLDNRAKTLTQLAKHRDTLTPDCRQQLVDALRRASDRCLGYADRLRPPVPEDATIVHECAMSSRQFAARLAGREARP
jgi:hypothetical protein